MTYGGWYKPAPAFFLDAVYASGLTRLELLSWKDRSDYVLVLFLFNSRYHYSLWYLTHSR